MCQPHGISPPSLNLPYLGMETDIEHRQREGCQYLNLPYLGMETTYKILPSVSVIDSIFLI